MSIDFWTLGFQTVNVAVLIWLLQRFFWRPVAAMIALRRTTAKAALAAAMGAQAKADAALKEIAATRTGFAAEREAILTEARAAAERDRAAILDEATKAAAALQIAAKAAIEQERAAAQTAWTAQAGHLAIQIATRLAARLEGPVVRSCFLDWLIQAIAALPKREQADLEVISAVKLDDAEQQVAADRIGEAFGCKPRLSFKTDPALIAGLELRGPHLQISNSWQADLATIEQALPHGP